jgi:hypothetical protein
MVFSSVRPFHPPQKKSLFFVFSQKGIIFVLLLTGRIVKGKEQVQILCRSRGEGYVKSAPTALDNR